GPIKEIVISYAGELADIDTQPLNRQIVAGVLAHHLGSDQVNAVNAFHLAKNRGINIIVAKSRESKGFTNLVSVTLRTTREERLVAGTTLNGFGPRITQIDKFPIDVEPQGHLLLVSHHDKPGIIGKVGTLLGNNGINIATMKVGRALPGGEAIMVLTVDKDVPKDVVASIAALPELNRAREIRLV